MKRAGAYGRISTQAQSGNTSLKEQESICRKYAEDHGYQFTKFYHDIQSGKNADRPALKELIEDVKAKTIDVVLFTKLDRLGRSIVDIRDIYDQITAFDVDIISIQQPGLSTDSATGRLMLNVLGSFAEFERDLIRSRMMEGRLSAWKSGKSIGALPFGYEQDESGKIRINKAQKKIIEKIVSLYLDKKLNVVQIADEMSKQKIPTPHAILDKIRNEKRIKEEKPPLTKKMASDRWGPSTIHRLLTNEAYTGKVTYNKSLKNEIVGIKKKAESTKPEDQWVEFTFPALISQERHEQIMQRLKNQRVKPKRKYSEYPDHFMIDGYAFCGECGGRIRKIIINDKRVDKMYLNYACHWRISGTTARKLYDRKQCILKSVSADEVDELVFSRVMEFLVKPQPDKWVKDEDTDKIKEDIAELYQQQSQIQDELKQGLQYITKVKESPVKAMYEAEQRKKEGEYQDITRKIEALEQDLKAIADKTARFEEFKKLSTMIKRNELKKHLHKLSFPEKKKIAEQLINPDGGGRVTIGYMRAGEVREEPYDDPNLTMEQIRELDDRPLLDRDPVVYIDFRTSPDTILDVIQGLKGNFIKSTRFLRCEHNVYLG